jgi:hypothetical protein
MINTGKVHIASTDMFDLLGRNVLLLEHNSTDVTKYGSSLKASLYFANITTIHGQTP